MQLGLPGSTASRGVIDGIRAGHSDPVLLTRVQDSFTDAFHVTGLVGVLTMGAVLVLVARATREPR